MRENMYNEKYLFREENTIDMTSDKGTFKHFIRSALHSKAAIFGFVVLLIMIICAIFSPLLAPNDPYEVNMAMYLKPPAWMEGGSWQYPLGTDSLGRCVLSRMIYGSRISMLVGSVAVIISGVLGVALGLIAGYFGKWVDDVIMRLADIFLAFPFVLLAIAVLTVLGSGISKVILILVVSGWVTYARLVRGEVISAREREYVEAARAIGLPARTIIFKHIFPNTINSVIVVASFSFSSTIISEASLSFLGLGVSPEVATWGGMISLAREYIFNGTWLAIFPGIAIALCVLGINILGDWIRDYLDPKTKV